MSAFNNFQATLVTAHIFVFTTFEFFFFLLMIFSCDVPLCSNNYL